jgi:hypothetical protein
LYSPLQTKFYTDFIILKLLQEESCNVKELESTQRRFVMGDKDGRNDKQKAEKQPAKKA